MEARQNDCNLSGVLPILSSLFVNTALIFEYLPLVYTHIYLEGYFNDAKLLCFEEELFIL